MRERFGAQDERSWKLRFHTQTGGVTLTAQQPENNIVRVALQGFAAVCGGTQSLHTNGFDEALALPTERAAKIAMRTQQILAYESGVADTVDPFAGSYFVEALTDEIETPRQRADRQGRRARRRGPGDRVHEDRDRGVGVRLPRALPASSRTSSSASTSSSRRTYEVPDIMRVDPASEREQVARLKSSRRTVMDARRSDGSRRSARRLAGPKTCCRCCARRSRTAARSARSAARCATSSAGTSPRSDARRGRRVLAVHPRPAHSDSAAPRRFSAGDGAGASGACAAAWAAGLRSWRSRRRPS